MTKDFNRSDEAIHTNITKNSGNVNNNEKYSEHEKKCHQFFEEILSGSQIFVHFDSFPIEDIGENQFEYDVPDLKLTIVTKAMLDYDNQALLENRIKETGYRPYFANFIIRGTYENYTAIYNYQLEDRWYEATIVTSSALIDNDSHFLYGAIQFSASPVSYIERMKLIFKNKSVPKLILDQINGICRDDFDMCSHPDTIFKEFFTSDKSKDLLNTIDIYNVGKGNADYIRGSKTRILYDIGYNYRCYPKDDSHFPYYKATNTLRKIKPTGVVLSHWDLDHIIGTAYAQQRIFDVPWIAPSLSNRGFDKASCNAYRLARYVNCFGNLHLIDRSCPGYGPIASRETDDYAISIFLGNGKDSYVTKRNCEGLYITIYMKNKSYLLSGDVPYSCMNNSFGSILPEKYGMDSVCIRKCCLFDVMHVPHHCSKMEIKNMRPYCEKKCYCAVISTNRSKETKALQVDDTHYKKLKKDYGIVIATIQNCMDDDNQNLSIQFDLTTGIFKIR